MNGRRRGDTPPDHPLDVHDTGRDHLTGPKKKYGDLHARSAKKNVETAAAPNNVIRKDNAMSLIINPTRHRRLASAWTAEQDENGRVTHAMGPAIWEPGVDIYTASDPHNGPRAYDADGHLIPAGDLLRYAVRLLQIHDELRRAQRHHELAARQEARN